MTDEQQTAKEPGLDEEAVTLSAVLSHLADHEGESVSINELASHFGPRAFGALLFIFALPNLLPLPPGSTTVLGAPLLLLAPQLALGGVDPWLPRAIGRRRIKRSVLASVFQRALPWVRKVERLSSRRLAVLFGGPGDLLIGLVCTLLAAVLVLPIPLGNVMPALSIVVLGLSLVQRDGYLALAGYALAAVSAGLLVVSGHLVVKAIAQLGAWTGAW